MQENLSNLNLYEKEVQALKKVNRYRTREIFSANLLDLSSNDYLGLAEDKKLFKKAYKRVKKEKTHSSKSSMLVNGYHKIHKDFEQELCEANNFEASIVLGSGFLGNIALIESLVRNNDHLFIDEEYHASGILATKLLDKQNISFFKHNDFKDLEKLLKNAKNKGRKILALEGIYSMQGDILAKEFFALSDKYGALMIVDEAHSCGVLGSKLLGVFDYYKITPNKNHIKLGTLGKAYGSYGAYILASNEVVDFLLNRAKPIIYSTSISLFDIALAHENFKYIAKKREHFKKKIAQHIKLANTIFKKDFNSLIMPLEVKNSKKALEIQEKLFKKGFLVAAIRQPTVKNAIIRLIAKIDINKKDFKNVCELLALELE